MPRRLKALQSPRRRRRRRNRPRRLRPTPFREPDKAVEVNNENDDRMTELSDTSTAVRSSIRERTAV